MTEIHGVQIEPDKRYYAIVSDCPIDVMNRGTGIEGVVKGIELEKGSVTVVMGQVRYYSIRDMVYLNKRTVAKRTDRMDVPLESIRFFRVY